MHLSVSTAYVEQRPLLWDLPHLPLLFSPDLVYLIDFYPAGHLYNTEQSLSVCLCVCVWVFDLVLLLL